MSAGTARGGRYCHRPLADRAGARPAPTGRAHCFVRFLSVGATLVVARLVIRYSPVAAIVGGHCRPGGRKARPYGTEGIAVLYFYP